MLILYILTAVFIAWIWVDYFRLIDLFDQEALSGFVMMFLLGAASVLLILGLHRLVPGFWGWDMNGGFLNDLLYCTFAIGLPEELAKITAFLIFASFYRRATDEPIDTIAYICVSALGFSAAENVMYFTSGGPDIISGRAILSTVGHMFDTALFGYGIVRSRHYYKKYRFFVLLWYLFLAAFSHGFYDFWLMYGQFSKGWIITVFYFLVTISLFSVILNNAINHSSNFSYHKVIDSDKVSKRMLLYYLLIFILQFILVGSREGIAIAVFQTVTSVWVSGFIIVVTVVRLSRFKLIHKRWHPLKPELPFGYMPMSHMPGENVHGFRIKGDSYNEIHLNNYYHDYFMLSPISSRSSYLEESRLAYIEDKVFLKHDEAFYLVKIFVGEEDGQYTRMLIKPKTGGSSFFKKNYPLVALLDTNGHETFDAGLSMQNFAFMEWAYVKPRQYFR